MQTEMMELVCLIDRSISMWGREEQVLRAYRRLLQQYQKVPQKCFVTTCLFSDNTELLWIHNEMDCANALTRQEYYVEGNTGLCDAVMFCIKRVEISLGYIKDEIKKQVHMYVITDGIDNGSVNQNYKEVLKLLEEKQKEHWQIYMVNEALETIEFGK